LKESPVSLETARKVIEIEIQALKDLSARMDDEFLAAVQLILDCDGRVVVSGIGKAGIIGRKISATLSSTGTPSIWMHSAEAVHGDLGQVTARDVVIIVSNSGETDETKRLLPIIKRIGSKMIAITGEPKSNLAKHSDIVLAVKVEKEGCPLDLAPMASTTAALVMGDALAACLLVRRGFRREDYALFHPGGTLGKRLLLRVEDVMRMGDRLPVVVENAEVQDVLLVITRARCGSACVVSAQGELAGIFTDGDLRRRIKTDPELLGRQVREVMSPGPVTITRDKLAVEALRLLQLQKIDELPVVDEAKRLVGLLDVQDLLNAGLL
jgi:arabinose-5-phosphate isomerase